MKQAVLAVILGISIGLNGFALYYFFSGSERVSDLRPFADSTPAPRPLDAYTIDALSQRTYGSSLVFDEPTEVDDSYIVRPFRYVSDGKTVSGLSHWPVDAPGSIPVVVQLRGYVDRSIYESGIGTKRSAEVFAREGFLSLAPDFLGYGSSDMPGNDVFEERFQTYTAALNLLAALPSVPGADTGRVYLWGHSNGGHIALAITEILGGNPDLLSYSQNIPVTLWAPVTRAFPYSILYYTDEAEDTGKALRRKLAEFEQSYDTDLYSIHRYLDRIGVPVQLHQGGRDDAVPQVWSDAFTDRLEELGKDIRYYVYPEADHNMVGSWSTVVMRDIEFFRSFN